MRHKTEVTAGVLAGYAVALSAGLALALVLYDRRTQRRLDKLRSDVWTLFSSTRAGKTPDADQADPRRA